jgi:hypothetical protein
MGVNILNSLRFPEVDYSSARNDFGGLYNAPSYPGFKGDKGTII